MTRILATLAVAAICLASEPTFRKTHHVAGKQSAESILPRIVSSNSNTTDPAELARTDPLALLARAIERYRTEIQNIRATLVKQERINGILHPQEVIDLAIREQPYSVRMEWREGARTVLLAKIQGVLYLSGENEGRIRVWRPGAFLTWVDSHPHDRLARSTSRYSITEAGLGHALERTYHAWSRAAAAGEFNWQYLGCEPIPMLDGRVCYRIRRTCLRPERDPFLMTEAMPTPASPTDPDAFETVTIMLDRDTLLQLGSELRRGDGELIASYYFRHLEVNPVFPANVFTPDSFRK
jgi:hypothetical protein